MILALEQRSSHSRRWIPGGVGGATLRATFTAMGSSVGEDLSAVLQGVRGGGSFATCRAAPVGDLAIEVTGIGPLEMPVTAAQARQLRLVARPAKYGQGEQTITDRRARDTWEVARSRVRIDKRRWNRTLRPMLDTIRDDLGLPPASSLGAQLHSMLLYERGQFFAAHQDSEKDDQMVATMVVILPSRSTGGELVVSHRGESVRYHGSGSSLTFVAFYADTRHEVLPVETGHRVALTYNLVLRGDSTAPFTDDPSAVTAAELLGHHFDHSPAPRWRGDRQALEPPDRLVVLLDHHYTERGLRWSHLKGHDATRVEILRGAAELVDCEVALAQAEIRETRECYEDQPPPWERRGYLVDPFAVEALLPTDAAILAALTDRHDLAWFDRRLSTWTEQRRPFPAGPGGYARQGRLGRGAPSAVHEPLRGRPRPRLQRTRHRSPSARDDDRLVGGCRRSSRLHDVSVATQRNPRRADPAGARRTAHRTHRRRPAHSRPGCRRPVRSKEGEPG